MGVTGCCSVVSFTQPDIWLELPDWELLHVLLCLAEQDSLSCLHTLSSFACAGLCHAGNLEAAFLVDHLRCAAVLCLPPCVYACH